jgi:3-oxo-5-alpha-steroid 4-dehydrogenase 1
LFVPFPSASLLLFVSAWIFPFLLSQPKPIPLCVMLMAFAFCVYNGWLQGAYLFTAADSAPHQYPKDWLELWRTRIGIAIFLFGWAANQHADYVLRHLRDNDKARKDGSESETKVGAASDAGTSEAVRRRYKIPYGGLFRWTSAANYTGEIIEWGGWALAANSAPATSVLSSAIIRFCDVQERKSRASQQR